MLTFFVSLGCIASAQIRFIGARAQSPLGISNYEEYAKRWLSWPSGFTFQNICVRPASKGTVRLRSGDYRDKPTISTGYLTAEEDVESIRNGLKLSRKLGTSDKFKKYASQHWSFYTSRTSRTSHTPPSSLSLFR